MNYDGLTGYSLAGIGERDPGRINKPVIPREGFPATLQGLNQRMPPVTPPEMFPGTLTSGSGGHTELAISSIIPRLTSLAGIGQRNFRRTALPIIPREGFPSTLLKGMNRRVRPAAPATCPGTLSGLNVRQPPVTPPEMYPSTLAGLDLSSLSVTELLRLDKSRLAALAIGFATYKKLPIMQAFIASMIAPWLVRPALGQDVQTGTKLIDGLEAVLAGLIAIGGGGFF